MLIGRQCLSNCFMSQKAFGWPSCCLSDAGEVLRHEALLCCPTLHAEKATWRCSYRRTLNHARITHER